MTLSRLGDRLVMILAGAALVVALSWVLFHPVSLTVIQLAIVVVAIVWRVVLAFRPSDQPTSH